MEKSAKQQRTPNTSVILDSLTSIANTVMVDLEEKISLHNFHDIGEELEILGDVYIIAEEIQFIK